MTLPRIRIVNSPSRKARTTEIAASFDDSRSTVLPSPTLPQPAASLMTNALEKVVAEVVERLSQGDARFCHCAQCRDDVIARALNNARPRYIGGSLIGSAVTRVALSHEQVRAEVAVLVLDAMRLVSANPRHAVSVFPIGGGAV